MTDGCFQIGGSMSEGKSVSEREPTYTLFFPRPGYNGNQPFVPLSDFRQLLADYDALRAELKIQDDANDILTRKLNEAEQRALAAEAKLAGGVVVPRKPTQAIMRAMGEAHHNTGGVGAIAVAHIYKVMLTAATGGTK